VSESTGNELYDPGFQYEDRFYMTDPKTDVLLFDGSKLENGMLVMTAEPQMRGKTPIDPLQVGKDSLASWLYQAKVYNRWCYVSDLRIVEDLEDNRKRRVAFIGIYEDGVQVKRDHDLGNAWIVKKSSMQQRTADQSFEAGVISRSEYDEIRVKFSDEGNDAWDVWRHTAQQMRENNFSEHEIAVSYTDWKTQWDADRAMMNKQVQDAITDAKVALNEEPVAGFVSEEEAQKAWEKLQTDFPVEFAKVREFDEMVTRDERVRKYHALAASERATYAVIHDYRGDILALEPHAVVGIDQIDGGPMIVKGETLSKMGWGGVAEVVMGSDSRLRRQVVEWFLVGMTPAEVDERIQAWKAADAIATEHPIDGPHVPLENPLSSEWTPPQFDNTEWPAQHGSDESESKDH
jgi:hypothetical protein